MSHQASKEYLAVIQNGYKNSIKSEKTRILNEAFRITGLSKKHVLHVLGLTREKLMRKIASGRPKKYPVRRL